MTCRLDNTGGTCSAGSRYTSGGPAGQCCTTTRLPDVFLLDGHYQAALRESNRAHGSPRRQPRCAVAISGWGPPRLLETRSCRRGHRTYGQRQLAPMQAFARANLSIHRGIKTRRKFISLHICLDALPCYACPTMPDQRKPHSYMYNRCTKPEVEREQVFNHANHRL